MLCAAHHVSYIGRAGVLREWPDSSEQCRAVGELLVVRPGEAFQADALCTLLNLYPISSQVQRLVRGQTAHLYAHDLSGLEIPVISIPLQEEVASRHSRAHIARCRAEALLTQIVEAIRTQILGVGAASQ